MPDLTTNYLGMTLRTPLVASASPLSDEISNIKRLEDAGASAVVLYSLFEEQIIRDQHEMYYHMSRGTNSHPEALTYFPEPETFVTGPDAYLEHIREAKQSVDIPIIASLNGSTINGWNTFARQVEQAGADALELNIYNIPTDIWEPGQILEDQYVALVESMRRQISIPLAVKLSPYFSNMANIAKRLEGAGANSLVLFNRFYQPDIDLEALEVVPRLLLSTEHELRLPLRWIAILYGRVQLDFAATTGVHSAEDALKLLMVGANVTMLASALIKNGIDYLTIVEQGLKEWLEVHEYESVKQLQGSMSQLKSANPHAFERAQYVRAVSTLPKGYKIF